MTFAAFALALVSSVQPAAELPQPAQDGRTRSGWVSNADYPDRELRRRIEGHTFVRLLVGANGRVRECQIVRSSGNSALDHRTCLVGRRFGFFPARDAAGQPVPQWFTFSLRWSMPHTVYADSPKPERRQP